MLDIGWTELVVIAIVLIVVVGPKDLPPMLRAFGRMTSKMRGMASEFRQQFDEALREADLDEVRKTISDAQSLNPANALRDAINPLRQMGNDIKADLQKAATPDQPATPNTVDTVSAVAPAAVEAKPADAVAAAAIGSANRQIERAEVASVPAEKPKRTTRTKADATPAVKKAAPKSTTAAPKTATAASKSATAKSAAKAPAKPAAEKKKVTPTVAEPAAKTSKPRTSARKKGEA
ncbi:MULTISPECIES: Sec-independent protein translocase protein TatB [unclassified Ensifer]|uniref:Sec-independent protein translocase protein TatB n=1 Tax=unclassified Ensifer TaxID=2633371 RepID=UPI000713822D|nr:MULTISPECIES: Sec-independent protein translocase protein TatB [unclassified Ensifer]KQX58404.1 preprotein translocase [Ensifer sp. Root1298]KQX88531.1 preprotein translocase [Ensifer sp. Root1312]KRC22142.1 preprotein translocase [Ensifer sp. Root74]KRD74301.1 preprotein translocase [Ensifer sp. Root954]